MGVRFADEVTPRDGFVQANGLRLHYLDWGRLEGRPLVLTHGLAQTCHSWDFTALALADRFRVLSFDLRGHGDSQWAPYGDYSLDSMVQDMRGAVEALGLRDEVVMGNSLGGRCALLYAAEYSETTKGLVVVDAAPEHLEGGSKRVRRFTQQPDVLDSFDEFAERVQRYNHRRPREQVRGSLLHNLKPLGDGRWTWKYDPVLRTPAGMQFRQVRPERLWDAAAAVRCPTLLVRGASSDVVAEDTLDRMQRRISGSVAVTVENAGHLVAGDNPVGFQDAVTPFLESLA